MARITNYSRMTDSMTSEQYGVDNVTAFENLSMSFIDVSTTAFTLYSTSTKSVAEKASEIFTLAGVLSYIFIVLGVTANLMSILATLHINHKPTMHTKLIINLGISDALVNITTFVHDMLYIYSDGPCVSVLKKILLTTALIMTLINLFAMAMDHYVAILHPFCYQRCTTSRMSTMCIVCIWILSVACGLVDIFVALGKGNSTDVDFCIVIITDEFEPEMILIGVTFIVLLFITVFYLKIYFAVSKLINHDRMQYPSAMHSSKKLVTTFLIIITFVIFWLPLSIFKVTLVLLLRYSPNYKPNMDILYPIHEYLFILLQVNTLCDPIIYAFRLKEVQGGYKRLFYKLFCQQQHFTNETGYRGTNGGFTHQRRLTSPTIINDHINSPECNFLQMECNVDVTQLSNGNSRMEESQFSEKENGTLHEHKRTEFVESKEDNDTGSDNTVSFPISPVSESDCLMSNGHL